jgi:hypothetical protein
MAGVTFEKGENVTESPLVKDNIQKISTVVVVLKSQ